MPVLKNSLFWIDILNVDQDREWKVALLTQMGEVTLAMICGVWQQEDIVL